MINAHIQRSLTPAGTKPAIFTLNSRFPRTPLIYLLRSLLAGALGALALLFQPPQLPNGVDGRADDPAEVVGLPGLPGLLDGLPEDVGDAVDLLRLLLGEGRAAEDQAVAPERAGGHGAGLGGEKIAVCLATEYCNKRNIIFQKYEMQTGS